MGAVAAVGYGGGRVAAGCGRVVVVERWRPPLAGARWRSGGGGRGHAVAADGRRQAHMAVKRHVGSRSVA
jgi:hypothetical protein